MDVHASENNLGEIIESSENTESIQQTCDDKNEEMNPYAVNDEGIHSQETNDNITVNMSQVIFTALLRIVFYRRTNRGWRNRQYLTYHPFWT